MQKIMNEDVVCPYCNHEQEVEVEGECLEDGEIREHECEECEKVFGVDMNMGDWYFGSPIEIPCRNGEPHELGAFHRQSPYGTLAKCKYCGDWKSLNSVL